MPHAALSPDIQKAPHKGEYYVRQEKGTHTWAVGERYELLKVLGEGSFSCVCLALDTQTGEKVAVKRVGDVLASKENAKRVLRECAILRRLDHPNIVGLKDLFVQPSPTGGWFFRAGQMVARSIDLYMVLEYCNQGDLFNLRGQLSEVEVQYLMMQLLDVLKYIHACDVWHRDIKSGNILVHNQDGRRIAKLCDFGSARSARVMGGQPTWPALNTTGAPDSQCASGRGTPGAMHTDTGHTNLTSGRMPSLLLDQTMTGGSGSVQEQVEGIRQSIAAGQTPHVDRGPSTIQRGDVSQHLTLGPGHGELTLASLSDLRMKFKSGSNRDGMSIPLTRAVSTPCYRAPEVIMSHGLYSSALDVWSLGCVFGEMLQRIPYLGKSSTPHLQVAPVISVIGAAATPKEGETFGGAGSEVTRAELQALFDVVGTPAWGTINAVVKHPIWHEYLKNIPGRPSQLHRRFAPAGDAAVDLLARMLEFDPSRRATAEEALTHKYFDLLKREMELWLLEEEAYENEQVSQLRQQHQQQLVCTPAPTPMNLPVDELATDNATQALQHAQQAGSTDMDLGEPVQPQLACLSAPTISIGLATGSTPLAAGVGRKSITTTAPMSVGSEDGIAACRPSVGGTPLATLSPRQPQDPGEVLAALERELENICSDADEAGTQRMREVLEKECDELKRVMSERDMKAAERLAVCDSWAARMVASSEGVSDSGDATPRGVYPPSPLHPAGAGGAGLFADDAEGLSGGGIIGDGSGGGTGAVAVPRRSTLPWPHWGLRRMIGSGSKRAGLKPDPGNTEDPSQIGKERLPHHRDSEQAGVEPEEHLREGRHGEWVGESLAEVQARSGGGGFWGVSLAPPGMHERDIDPGMLEAIRQQHAR